MTPDQRFWSKVDRNGPLPGVCPELGSCWLWTGIVQINGYGRFSAGKLWLAHRWAYEEQAGRIAEGLDIDHLCRTRLCVRPSHLDAVTRSENLRRGVHHERLKTHCPQGHPFNEQNTQRYKGKRRCRACRFRQSRAQREGIRT